MEVSSNADCTEISSNADCTRKSNYQMVVFEMPPSVTRGLVAALRPARTEAR